MPKQHAHKQQVGAVQSKERTEQTRWAKHSWLMNSWPRAEEACSPPHNIASPPLPRHFRDAARLEAELGGAA
jgi:hypothetical protein